LTGFDRKPARREAAVLLALLVALAARPSVAGPPDRAKTSDARVVAQSHLDRGNALFTHDHFADALAEFEAAFSLFPSPKLHFNLGQCERALGHDAAAAAHFQRFLDEATAVSPTLRAEAERYLTEARVHVAEGAPREAPAEPATREPAPAVVPAAPPPALTPAPAPPALAIAPAPPALATAPAAVPPRRSFLTRWWFWTALGAVAAGVVAIVVLARPHDPPCGGGMTCFK
jgi:tetratricopeptide (TPR) repeat protein